MLDKALLIADEIGQRKSKQIKIRKTMASEVYKTNNGGASNPRNAVSSRTRAFAERNDYRHEESYLNDAISNRSDDLIRRYNQGYGPRDRNVPRIRNAEMNMRRRLTS